jgi:hypothetical protein
MLANAAGADVIDPSNDNEEHRGGCGEGVDSAVSLHASTRPSPCPCPGKGILGANSHGVRRPSSAVVRGTPPLACSRGARSGRQLGVTAWQKKSAPLEGMAMTHLPLALLICCGPPAVHRISIACRVAALSSKLSLAASLRKAAGPYSSLEGRAHGDGEWRVDVAAVAWKWTAKCKTLATFRKIPLCATICTNR